MRYYIEVGAGNARFYVSDDQPLSTRTGDALCLYSREAADREAETIRKTWNLKPARGPVPAMRIVERPD